MAFVAGRSTQVLCGGYDISAYLSGASLSLTWTLADTTTFGSRGRTRIATTNSASLTSSGVWDPTQDSILNATGGADGSIVTYLPAGGSSVGDRAWMMYGATIEYAPDSGFDDAVRFSWNADSEALVMCGNVLHPLGEDTNTTTGSTRDDGAATSTGWTAQLHVTGADAGSWVIKIQHATASNFSDVADVTGGAFTAATGATSQRLTSAAGATLNRYIRYVATRTGGTTGDGITFALAISRTL